MKKILQYIGLLVFIIQFLACSKSSFNINNDNPNSPGTMDINFVLGPCLKNIAELQNTGTTVRGNEDYSLEYWAGYWTIGGGYITNASIYNFTFDNTYLNGIWNGYWGILSNLQYVNNNANGNNFYRGIVKALNVVCYHNLVDMYGNIPYSQALQPDKYPQAVYDNAADIYNDLFKQLDSARILIKNGSGEAPAAAYDIMYNASASKWISFINTLQLRILLRVSNLSAKPSYFQTALTNLNSSITNGDGFINSAGNEAAVNPGYYNLAGKANPMFATFWNITQNLQSSNYIYYRANAAAVNFYLDGNIDWRVQRIYAPYDNNGDTKGGYFGVPTANNDTLSGLGQQDGGNGAYNETNGIGILKSYAQATPLLPASESYFLQAEAAYKGMIGGDYHALYQSGVEQSFIYAYSGSPSYWVNNDITDADTYISQTTGKVNNYNVSLTTNPVETIISQKWIALNGINPLEAYSEYRRTGFPSYIYGSKYAGAPQLPNRLYYPRSEYATNAGNVKAQGPDLLTNKIFWAR